MRVSGLAVLFEITCCPRKELNLAQPDAGNALHFPSLIAQPIALAKWWLEGTGSAATRLSKHDRDKFTPKKPKDKCEGGPCPTTVPEPATAMLLIIGMGLASVAAHYRFRL
jgi:PEP-CTERM motif-containing protein